jgi:hypothetical protein
MGKKKLNSHQGDVLRSLMHYVQTFSTMLNLIPTKEEYVHNVAFFPNLQPWVSQVNPSKGECVQDLLGNDQVGKMYGG